MEQIVSVIGFYIVLALMLTILLRLVFMYEKDYRRKQCMMNHPAGKPSGTAHLPIGQTHPILVTDSTGKVVEVLHVTEPNPRALLEDGGR